ncbi:MAG TPA: hypothetical protein PKK51_06630, partial [Rhodocyclaceae bacterium]|nr:hypothetical protein [Rhodocyclaceae bacterium]
AAAAAGYGDAAIPIEPAVPTQDARHGDYQSNHAFRLGKALRQNPRAVADAVRAALPSHPAIASAEVAGPGFINFTLSDRWLGEQIVARGADNGQVDLEWLYASYRASENITLQAGRKRLPLFYYSESQDVGLTLPWLRLPPAAYGWDVVNFNGASVLWRTPLGKWNSAAEVFYGAETRRGNPYLDIYNGRGADWDEKWNNIRGLSWTVSRDWLELRVSYVASGLKYWNPRDVAATFSKTRQSVLSLAAAIDLDHWLIRAEVSKIDRPGFAEHDRAALLGAGYRLGKWLPMITFARFHGRYLDGTPNERFDNLSLSLRYDLTPSSALKLQFDSFKDRSDVGITCYQDPVTCLSGSQRYGDSRLLGVSYDLVF